MADSAGTSPAEQAVPSRNPLRRLYHWVLSWADRPGGAWALFGFSTAESVIFPIPPDPLLLALVLGKPEKAWRYAGICTLASLLGAAIGYVIGYGFWEATKGFWLEHVFSQKEFDAVGGYYNRWDAMGVFAGAFTPLPFKAFTITAGLFKLNFLVFMLAAAAGRSMRFFAVAAITRWVGPRAKPWIEKWFNLLALLFFVLLVGGILAVKVLWVDGA